MKVTETETWESCHALPDDEREWLYERCEEHQDDLDRAAKRKR